MEFFDGIFEKTRQLENEKQWAKPTVFNVSADDRNRTCTPLGHKNLNLARLPVPPHPHVFFTRMIEYHNLINYSTLFLYLRSKNNYRVIYLSQLSKA